MKHTAILILIFVPWLSGKAATNVVLSTAVLLDDKTVYELTDRLQEYEKLPNLTGKFTSFGNPGATILLNHWASEFITLYPHVELDVRGGGGEAGFSELIDGKVDMVPVERPLRAEEVARFKAKFGYPPTEILIAQTTIGIYVNKTNPISGLTLAQLDAIFSAKPKRGGGRPEFWKDLGVSGALADQRISRVSLNQAHGMYLFFREHIMQGADYRLDVHFETVPSSLVQACGADDASIGATSVIFATPRTRFVPLQGSDGRYCLPTYKETLDGRYPLIGLIRIIFTRRPDGSMNFAAREFLRFSVSRRGQRIVALAGSYPLTVEQQNQALQRIGGPR